MTNYFKHKIRSKSPAQIAFWVVLGALGIIGLIILCGFVTMWLWNALMPDIFGLIEIDYWQAVGLLILFKILFTGFGGGSNSNSSSKKKDKSSEKSFKNDFSKWELYDKFWEEEGEKAYQDYIDRNHGIDSEE